MDASLAAAATVYGWAGWAPAIADDEMLRRLPALNLAPRLT